MYQHEQGDPSNYHHQDHMSPGHSNGNTLPNDVYSNASLHGGHNDAGSETITSLPQLLHWSEVVYEVENVQIDDWNVAGGSDYGQLPYLIDSGDILLEVDDHKVAGFTRNDVLDILHSKQGNVIKAVSSSSSFGLPIDLREYLSRRFVRGSVDHDLQATIRDNVYLRTIPCTTRPPRPGEIDNVDYKFVTRDEFLVMERSGVLLESGIYTGHYYGTPLPLSNPSSPNMHTHGLPPGLTHSHSQPNVYELNVINNNSPKLVSPPTPAQQQITRSAAAISLANKRKRNRSNIAAIDASSLPHGWEKISDAHYGVYYIDHINKRTQYERPYELELTKGTNGFGFTLIELDRGLVVVKNVIPGGPAYHSGVIQPGDVLVSVSGVSVSGLQHSDIARLFATFSVGDRVKLTFARGYQLPPDINNDDAEFEFASISITKGHNGFGFTISDGNAGQKVKKILDMDRCGNLRQGDLLASVNGLNLAPLNHTQVVEVLKNCSIGDTASITVKRKKRFRSKTPINLQSASYAEKEDSMPPPRNCKTPSCEMMMRRDLDWMVTDSNGNAASHHRAVRDTRELPPMPVDATYDQNLNSQNALYANGDYAMAYLNEQRGPSNSSKSAPQLIRTRSRDRMSLRPDEDYNQQAGMQQQVNPHLPSLDDVEMNPVSPVNGHEEEYEYYRVALTRSESGFGFRIVGGAEEGRNVAIGSIVIGGVAHQDGILKSGDEIISINDRNVMGASHHHVVELMSHCRENTTLLLLVRRKKDSDAFDVLLHREPTEGFGFVIISCGNCALIGRIIDGSPAQRCQRLRIRDRIIAVNGQDITAMSHPDIVNMIKESGHALRLKIIPSDCYTVELVRGPRGFGFSIRGGAEFNGMPLFILRIAPDGPAFSLLNVGDEIIEINNLSTVGMSHTDAVQLISQSGLQVKLKLRRNGTPANISPAYGVQSSTMTSSMSYGPSNFNSGGQQAAYSSFPFSYSTPNMGMSAGVQVEAQHVNTYSSP